LPGVVKEYEGSLLGKNDREVAREAEEKGGTESVCDKPRAGKGKIPKTRGLGTVEVTCHQDATFKGGLGTTSEKKNSGENV